MSKEKLHVYYDKINNEVKAEFTLDKYMTLSSWQDILQSLLGNSKFKRNCYCDGLVVEYSDIIIQIDDWKECCKNQMVNKYIQKTIALQLNNRLNTVKEYNRKIVKNYESVSNSNEDLLPEYIQRALKERKERVNSVDYQTRLTVSRKNKFVSVVPIIVVGSLTIASLTCQSLDYNKNNDIVAFHKRNESLVGQNLLETKEITDNFKVDLNVDDILINSHAEYNNVSLKYDNLSQTDKAIATKLRYGNLIEKYAKKCGIDPRIVLGIATQESGDHELGLRSGSKGGLMQIEISYWKNKEITYYDFDEKESYIIKIDDNIEDVENNILIGCAILQNELKTFNYNIPLAIQSYNEGYSNMSKILDETSIKTGLTKTSIINDDHCLEWLNYTDTVTVGDPNYVNNVLSWTGYGYDFYELTCKKENGDIKVSTTIPMVNNFEKAI